MDANLESDYVGLLGKGDHKAFDMLFAYYYPKVKYFVTGFVKNEEVASDLSQDIFFKVWVNRETIAKASSFKNYLFRMARNLVYDYFEQTVPCEEYDAGRQEAEEAFSRKIVETEELIYAKELSLLIDILIGRMPPQRKRIFIMSRKEGFSNDEIAEALSISKRTVENHITQALHEIRKVIFHFILLFIH